MIVSAIVAMGKNRVIGKQNKMLWHLPMEFKHFKQTTMGHHLIMGRKTFESHPPLQGRTSIVVTRDPSYKVPDGNLTAGSVEQAIAIAKERNETEAFVSGGGEIYKLALPYLQKIYLTEVDFFEEGDAYFPEINLTNWKLESEKKEPIYEKNNLPWTLKIYTKN